MSVRTNQYIILGVQISKETFGNNNLYDKFENYIDNGYDEVKIHNGLSCVYDGMNGKFVLLGKILHRSDLDETIDGPIVISESSYLDNMIVADAIMANFPELNISADEIKPIFVTYYH